MCFGINFNSRATTPRIIALFDRIATPLENRRYLANDNLIEVIGPDGKGGWDAFGITHTLRGNQCRLEKNYSIDDYFKYVDRLRREPGKTKGVMKLIKQDVQQVMQLNNIIFKNDYGTGPYGQMMQLPYVCPDITEKIAERMLATRYKKMRRWKPDPLLTFDIRRFRQENDFRDCWYDTCWMLTPMDIHFGDTPFGQESFTDDDIVNQDVWQKLTHTVHTASLKDFILGVRTTKTDPLLCLIMYVGVIRRPLSNYGYSAVWLCICQHLGYYLTSDLMCFTDMLDDCIGLTGDEKTLIRTEIEQTPFRNFDGTVRDYCDAWKKRTLPTIPPDPYVH